MVKVSTGSLLFEQVLANLPAHVFVVDLETHSVVFSNYSLRWALGYPVTVSEDGSLEDILHSDDGAMLDESVGALEGAGEGATVEFDIRMKAVDGSWRWFSSRARVFARAENGMPLQIAAVSSDSSPSKLVTGNKRYQALQDPLTDLLNRQQFLGAVERVVAAGRVPSTLCICDIDYFKGVNESYGHLAGDRVLRAFAEILKRTLRHGDVIARFGADEFAILFPGVALSQCAPPMERVREQLASTRFPMGGDVFSVTASFGLAPYEGSGGGQLWIEAADRALRESKRRGRNQTSRID